MTATSVPLPDFAPEGRPASVVTSDSARRNAGRTLAIVESRLDGHRGGRWLDIASDHRITHWSIGDEEDGLDVEIDLASHAPLGTTGPSCIVVRMGDFLAIRVSCRSSQAMGLLRDGPSATAGWAVAACRLALAQGRSRQPSIWRPKPALVTALRALHREDVRHRRGYVCVAHPSPLSDAAATISISDFESRLHETMDVQDVGFVPPRPCRLVARSRLGAGGRNAGAPPGVQLLATMTHLSLDDLDAMQILRLLAASDGTVELKGRRRA